MGDYTNFHRPGEKAKRPANEVVGVGARWWLEKPDVAAESISANISYWANSQRYRMWLLNRWARIYGNMTNMGYGTQSVAVQSLLNSGYGDLISYNVSGSAADTLVAKICRNKPKPYFLTDAGDYKAQRLAKNRNKFLAGVFYENDTFALTRVSVRDATVWGDGIVHVFARNGRVAHERVLPAEIFVDEIDSLNGKPRQMHRIKFVDRDVLAEMFPDSAEQIANASWQDQQIFMYSQHMANMVCVRESWHLRSGPDADDGVHVLTINGHALTDMEPWTRDDFPFAFLAYTPRMYGMWSQGLMEQGQSIQFELNKIAGYIQQTIEAAGTQKIFVKAGSGISTDQINDNFNAIIEGEEAPQYMTPQMVQPELYGYVETLIQRYYKLAGIAQSDASSTKPTGDLSGEAIRLIHDIGTERFVAFGQQYEEFHLKIARLSIQTAMEIMEDNKAAAKKDEKPIGYAIKAPGRGTMDAVDFEDLGFQPNEQFYLQCFPVSALVSDPAGRTQMVQDYVQAGWISAETARDLIDFPDTGEVEGLHNAAREFAKKTLDAMIDDGQPYVLEPYDDANLWLELALEYYNRSRRTEVPEKKLQMLRNLIDDANRKVIAAQAPPPQVAPANPTPTPTSQLLPNTNQ